MTVNKNEIQAIFCLIIIPAAWGNSRKLEPKLIS